jgi:hypothetical protein
MMSCCARDRYSRSSAARIFFRGVIAVKSGKNETRTRIMPFPQGMPPASHGAAPHRSEGTDSFWLSFNVHGSIVYCTEQLARLCGRNAAQMHGATVATLLPGLPLDGNTARQKVAAMMGYVNGCHPLQLAMADGRTLPVEATITSVLVEKGPLFIVNLRCGGSR